MSSMTKEGIIYARVSSHKQVTDGNGLSSQISACKAFAKKKNIEVDNDDDIVDEKEEEDHSHRIQLLHHDSDIELEHEVHV
mgnify:CR=1 FL=1